VRRALSLVAIVVAALLLQTTVFADVRLLGARPELLYLVTICFAMLEGSTSGAITGFVSGMSEDFLLNQPKGITALTLTILGYAVGLLRQYIVSPSALVPVFVVALGTFGGVVFYGVVSFLLGQLDTSWVYLMRVAALSAAYNAILTPIAYPLIRRIAEGSRSQRVVRW